ncbi:hypothetical protein OJ998_35680 [Solirubrobacter taibaiensis]|nr:hypothetical protein [Solirubrobacter taibaiensis]
MSLHVRLHAACALVLLLGPAPASARAVPLDAERAAARIVDAWAVQPRDRWGTPIDPVSGLPGYRYSQAMLASAALGLPAPTAEQRAFAEHLLLWLSAQGPHTPPSVFEIGAAADAYTRLPPSSRARALLHDWLKTAPARVWIKTPPRNPLNRWMVEAEGALARCRIAGLPNRRALCALGRTFVTRTFPAAARRWTTVGRDGRRVTVMSDPTDNPIAYHHLTLGYFAHALSRLARVPRAARRVLVQMARGTVAITAPDGDAAYWGRSQGTSWTLAFGAYGLRRAQRFTTRAEAARFEHTAQSLLSRYRDRHEGGPVGVAIVPAYRDDPLTRHVGLDSYANVATYAGLTAMALSRLARTTPRVPARAAPSTGHAQDRGNGAFATARARGTWLAVRAHGHRTGDPRYDFGLVAAKHRTPAGWHDLVASRPAPGARPAPAGPLLTVGGVTGKPDGESVAVAANGTVTVRGGWRGPDGAWLRRASFTFRPTATGVIITLPVRARDEITYCVFAGDPQLVDGAVVDRGVRTSLSLASSGTQEPESYASASDRRLARVVLSGVVPSSGVARVVIETAGV